MDRVRVVARATAVVFAMVGPARAAQAWGGMAPHAPRHGDFCRDEAYDYVARKLQGVRILSSQYFGMGTDWQLWAKVSACSDSIVFVYDAVHPSICESPGAYGPPVRSLRQVWGYGDCDGVVGIDFNPLG